MQTVKIQAEETIDTIHYSIKIHGVLEENTYESYKDDCYQGLRLVFYSYWKKNTITPWENTYSTIQDFLLRFDLKERK